MCGLAGGLSSTLVDKDRMVIRELLMLNKFRGTDSTGMFVINNNLDKFKPPEVKGKGKKKAQKAELKRPARLVFWKTRQHPVDFGYNVFPKQEYDLWKECSPCVIAGHTRAATVGKITEANAHPFNFQNVIGMHNGTIHSDFSFKKDFETDSEAIFKSISEQGLDKTLAEINSSSLSNAYALVYYDKQEKNMCFVRNGLRPLHFLESSGCLFWSSDRETLEFAKHVYKLSGMVTALPIDVLMTIPVTDFAAAISQRKMQPLSKEALGSKSYRGYAGGYGEYYQEAFGLHAANASTDEELRQKPIKVCENPAIWGWSVRTGNADVYIPEKKAYISPVDYRSYREKEDKLKKDNKMDDSIPFDQEKKEDKSKQELMTYLSYPFGMVGGRCSHEAWKQKTAAGCAFCGNPVHSYEAHTLLWFNNDEFLCERHAKDVKKQEGDYAFILEMVPNIAKLPNLTTH